MKITGAVPSDLNEAVGCLAVAFAQDPITVFLRRQVQVTETA